MEIVVDCRDLDEIAEPFLGLWVFHDERPLKGYTGLMDWKCDGRLSRLLQTGHLSGDWQEKMLLRPMDAGFDRLMLLMGLGARGDFDAPRACAAGELMMRTVAALGRDSLALSVPGSSQPGLEIVEFAEHFLDGIMHAGPVGFVPRILCQKDEVDEVLLGFQKTKVRRKDTCRIDISQVKTT